MPVINLFGPRSSPRGGGLPNAPFRIASRTQSSPHVWRSTEQDRSAANLAKVVSTRVEVYLRWADKSDEALSTEVEVSLQPVNRRCFANRRLHTCGGIPVLSPCATSVRWSSSRKWRSSGPRRLERRTLQVVFTKMEVSRRCTAPTTWAAGRLHGGGGLPERRRDT